MMIHWDWQNWQGTTCSPPYESLPHLVYYNWLSYQSLFVCPGRQLLCHDLSLLQHWVHGCTTHFFVEIPYFLSNSQWMHLPTISCRIRYLDSPNTGQPLLRSITVSLSWRHKLHIGDTSWPSIWCFIEFTCSACSYVAHTIASVSFLRCPLFNHRLYAHFLCIF